MQENEHFSTDSNTVSTEEDTYPATEKPMYDFCIVIDAGHGGNDPGKVGINGEQEKNINLAIALLLKKRLETEHIPIILTRTQDQSLATPGSKNEKRADMQKRCEIITDANPVFTISIHQNSFPSEEVSGAQVFYYTHSHEGAALATTIQNALKQHLDPGNTRQPKANDSYYLLKKTPTPTIIVECGFLSNPAEANLLSTPEYQEKTVNAIASGVLVYLEEHHLLSNATTYFE